MDSAIDNYAKGKQKEVLADDLQIGHTVSASEKRFVCPECGEYVFFSPKRVSHNRTTKAYFGHLNLKINGIDCEKRIKHNEQKSFYQRVGQDIVIKKGFGSFKILMAFEPLGSDLIDSYENESARLNICADQQYSKTIEINHYTFFSNSVTLIPFDFVVQGNYDIKIENGENNAKWASFAEGFGHNGAIFACENDGGKKIRTGSYLATNREYYLVSNDLLIQKIPSIISYQHEGYLKVKNQTLNVGRISYHETREKDQADFELAQDFFNDFFKLRLLYENPEIIPIWPPAIRTEANHINYEKKYKAAFFYVKSGNDQPTVYRYNDNTCDTIPCEKDNTLIMHLQDEYLPISVDRRYIGTNYYIASKEIGDYDNNINISIIDDNDQPIDYGYQSSLPINNRLHISTSQSVVVFVVEKENVEIIPIQSDTRGTISELNNRCALFIWGDTYLGEIVFYHHEFEQEKELNASMISGDRSMLVPTPRWITSAIGYDSDLDRQIVNYIRTGKMPKRTRMLLEKIVKEDN